MFFHLMEYICLIDHENYLAQFFFSFSRTWFSWETSKEIKMAKTVDNNLTRKESVRVKMKFGIHIPVKIGLLHCM